MKSSYLDYAMSVIVSRALPDVRDGLKPVHRRILYGAQESGFIAGRPYRKSARLVGDVMGKYHPHGDSSIYDALARMTQDWSMRLPLIDGQGNFGSMDPDPPAAMRYTEARLARSASALLDDIDKDTVDFQPNYDGSETEPVVLPARFPNLLVNGAGGIAVGMATNIPPHNLGEVIAACKLFIERESLGGEAVTTAELMEIVPAPDFPTGGIILGLGGARSAYETGRGSVIVRSRHEVEESRGDRRSIVLTEIPFQVGKNGLVEKIAEAAKEKRIEGVADIRDESSREGVRIVLELKRDATPEVVLNQLWRHTPAQSSFPANMLAIRGGRPELLGLRDIIAAFVTFREEVITRRSKHELFKARERAHVLLGLVVAVSNLDEVVRIIRGSASPAAARAALLAREWPIAEIAPYIALVEAVEATVEGDIYTLSDTQVRAILDLRLHRLTALGRDEIGDELQGLAGSITELLEILGNRARLYEVLVGELDAVSAAFATPRRTQIAPAGDDIDDEDLIEREAMVVTVTLGGYIKRTPLDTFRTQAKGGKGRSGMATKDEDAVTKLFVTSTHTPVLFFSNRGKAYRLKVYRLPEGAPQARGRSMNNLLPLAEGETISTVLALPENVAEWGDLHILFATARGLVRRNSMDAFANVPTAGKIAMRFSADDGSEDATDRLIGVSLLTEGDDVLLATRGGKAIRFAATDVREFQSRTASGRARRAAGRWRRGDLAVDPQGLRRHHRGARGVSARRPVEGERRRADAGARAHGRVRRRRGVHPHGLRQRLWQAFVGLRISSHRPRRAGHHQHRQSGAQRPGRGELPRAWRRGADAGHRPGQADPHVGGRHPRHRPRQRRRDPVPRRIERTCRLRRAHRRDRRGGRSRRRRQRRPDDRPAGRRRYRRGPVGRQRRVRCSPPRRPRRAAASAIL